MTQRSEFVNRILPIIKQEHKRAMQRVQNQKFHVHRTTRPEARLRQEDKLEDFREIRDALLILRQRLERERAMWDAVERESSSGEGKETTLQALQDLSSDLFN